MALNAAQTEQLLRGVNPKRVLELRGQSHLAGWDVEAHLTRIFGFEGWDKRIRSIELVFEDGTKRGNSDRIGWYVTYRCLMTLIIKDPQGNVIREIEDGATGSAENLPSRGGAHDFAYKNAITFALKRCAKDLGDQFGLSLYNDGSRKPTIIQTLAAEQGDVEEALPDEVHPDFDADSEPGESQQAAVPSANGHAAPTADDPVYGAWAAKIDEIATPADVEPILAELDRDNRGGLISNMQTAKIRGAIKDKAALVANGHKPAGTNGGAPQPQPARPSRPKGPPAEERGAVPVSTGKGDDGDWVAGFMQRLDAVTDPDLLGDFQRQVGAAVKAKTVTPAKSVDLTAAIRNHRNKLQAAAV